MTSPSTLTDARPFTLSVVIPMMDEADGLDALFARLTHALAPLDCALEFVCVNDGSSDETVAALRQMQQKLPHIVIVDLSRNFGKEAALSAGLHEATGTVIVPLDADLQDPPELIPEMVQRWREGAEVVIAIRQSRDSDSLFKRATASAFYRIINRVSDITIPPHAGDFRLMDRKVVEALKRLPERTRFNKGLFAWLGFNTVEVAYERPVREAGDTKWRYAKLWTFAIDGITSFSSLPLRIWSYIGTLIALGALVYGFVIIMRVLFFGGADVPGYASLMTVTLFSCGLTLTGLGVIGEYLSRVFLEVKQRPLYVVREVIRPGETDLDR
jgi:glycosyltransferase involved in cell wall biosynthesis